MPETIMPLLTGLFLVFAGMLIGYFLWFRDRTQDEALRLRLQTENEDLGNQLRRLKSDHESMTSQLTGQKGKLHILQELCDDLVAGREQFQVDRVALEASANESRRGLEEMQNRFNEEKRQRISAEDRLHQERQKLLDKQATDEKNFRDQLTKAQNDLTHQKSETDRLASAHERATEKLHAAEATVAELKSELATQRSIVETVKQNASGREKDYVTLETSLKGHSELLKESRGQCAAALSAKKLAEENVRDLRLQVEEYKERLSKMDEIASTAESTKIRCISMQQSLDNNKGRLLQVELERNQALSAEKKAHETVATLQTRLENQETTIRNMAQKSEELAIELKTKRDGFLELESTVSRLTGEVQHYEDEIASLQEGRNELVASTTEEKDSLVNRVNQLTASIDDRESQIVALSSRVDELTSELQRYQQEALTLNSSREEVIASARDEKKSLLDRIHQLNIDLQEREEQISELRAQLDDVQTLKMGRERLATQIATMEQTQLVNSTLLEKRLDDLEAMRSERDGIAEQLANLRAEMARGETSFEQQLSQIESLRHERDNLADRLAGMEREHSEFRMDGIRQRDEVQSRINQLVSQRDQAFDDIEVLRKEIQALRAEIEELRQREEAEPVILAMHGEEVDEEYGGRLQVQDARGKVYVEAPQSRDDLKLISGIAEVLEKRLNDFGIYTFKQIMEWKEENIQEFCMLLAFKDRIDRDDWISQARDFYNEKRRRAA